MTEERVGFLYFLYKIASQLSNNENNLSATHLRSFYLMRCHDITRSYGLPTQQFSPNLRCSHCCNEWKPGTYETKITPSKLSKKQRHKLKSYKVTEKNKDYVKSRQVLLNSNQLERTCHSCKRTTVISMTKPTRTVIKRYTETTKEKADKVTHISHHVRKETVSLTMKNKKIAELNVYKSTQDVFSLKNKDNVLASTVKDTPKLIKNNKRKKDKFAGLCREAVMATAKEKSSKNKLDLFLKPSA